MELAEALANRADLQQRLEQMHGRLAQSALVQENESPPEVPQELLAETERLLGELARRDALGLRYGLLGGLVRAASDRLPRYGRAEIRTLPTVEVAPLRRRMDEAAKERRELDTMIQAANWTTELME